MQDKKTFKENNSLEERINLCQKLKQDNQNKIPIILERSSKCKIQILQRPEIMIDKNKKVLELNTSLLKKLEKTQSLYLFQNQILMNSEDNLNEIYEKYKDEDGFLYITYNFQDSLG